MHPGEVRAAHSPQGFLGQGGEMSPPCRTRPLAIGPCCCPSRICCAARSVRFVRTPKGSLGTETRHTVQEPPVSPLPATLSGSLPPPPKQPLKMAMATPLSREAFPGHQRCGAEHLASCLDLALENCLPAHPSRVSASSPPPQPPLS